MITYRRLLTTACLLALTACAAEPEGDDEVDAASEAAEPDAAVDEAAEPAPEAVDPGEPAPEPVEEPEPLPDEGEVPETEAESFDSIYEEVLVPNGCNGDYCHHVPTSGDRDRADEIYEWITTARAGSWACREEFDNGLVIVPGRPEESLLYLKVAPGVEVCGEKMPLALRDNGLTAEDAARLRAWIAAGARR